MCRKGLLFLIFLGYYFSGMQAQNSTQDLSCVGTQNALYREVWEGIGGFGIADLVGYSAFQIDNPTFSETIRGGIIPENVGDNYGQRIRGFIKVARTGVYQFNITGDDEVDVYLGTTEAPSSQVKIAEINGWTFQNEHAKYSEQTSRQITLVAGQYYYLEILHKEWIGGDHVTLFWKTPSTINSNQWARVSGVHFWSYDCGSTSIASCSVDADGDGVCSEDDCNDNDASVGRRRTRGTSCDDGNPNTINDQISPDGCSCAGTPSPIVPITPSCSVDADGDGVCSEDDCNDNDASVGRRRTRGTSCDDGNPNTINDQISPDGCSCAGTPSPIVPITPSCSLDADNDGVCADEDCNDFDASVGRRRSRGTSCDDGNPNTINDQISPDGCSCAGTPSPIVPPSISSCVGTQNTLYREIWQGVGGSKITDLKEQADYPNNPTVTEIIVGGTIPNDIGDNYGQRLRGFIQAPQSGVYQFNITGDDDIDVFLGTNEAPSSRVKIAEVNGWTTLNEHDKYSEQTSSRINLVAGQYYYLEILHKEEKWGDHVNLYWKTPTTINSSQWVSVPGDRFWGYNCASSITSCSVDADGDGVCFDVDCNDNNPNLPAAPGTSCVDGNPNTINDQIGADGCTCTGTPRPIDPPGIPSCLGVEESLHRELWLGIEGATIADLEGHTDYPNTPTASGYIIGGVNGIIPDNINIGDNYGQRIRGFIQVPQSGEYQFNITGGDDVDVYLGTTEAPNSRVKIAEVNGWTSRGEHTKYREQTSDLISLTAGQFYYLEILQKEGGGDEHVNLYWKTPATISSGQWVSVPDIYFWSYNCEVTSIDPSLLSCNADADRDGICAENDCNDNDPNVPTRLGTSCDDGNSNTENDRISGDGCSCVGTPIVIDPIVPSCLGSQYALSREVWQGIPGSTIGDLVNNSNYPDRPSSTVLINEAATPIDYGNNYGQRIRGFIQAPQTGTYTFNVTGDDAVVVVLNTDTSPNTDGIVIAGTNKWTEPNEHDKFSSQTSNAISLEAGQYYYLEILHKDGTGGDHLRLFWKTPNNSTQWTRIPPTQLWSYDCNDSNAESLIEESCGSDLTIAYGKGTITINGSRESPYTYTLFNVDGIPINSCFSDCALPHVISGLTEASYLLRVAGENNANLCFKIIEFPANTNVGSGSRRAAHLSFEAFKSNREVDLQWLTNSSYKVKAFDVERSLDGVHFTKLKTFSNQEWGADMAYHQMVDQEPVKGINYYRIKQIYADDSFEYTNTKIVRVDIDLGEYTMYPNPASNELFFNLKPFVGKEATIQIINTVGVLEKSIAIDKIELEQFVVSLDDMTNGIYLVLIKVDDRPLINKKLVIHKLY